MTEPVLTEFGYHIIKLLEFKESVVPTFDELAEQLEVDYRLLKAEELFVAKSARLSELAYESQDLEGIALELDLSIQSAGWLSRDSTEGLAARSQVLNAAFSEDLLIDGNNSDLIEIDPDYHVVVRVNNHKESELKELDDVRSDIHFILKVEASREKAVELKEHALELLASGSITRYVADQVGGVWVVLDEISRQHPALNPLITREAFKLPRPADADKTVGWTILNNGDAVVITLTKINDKEVSDLGEEEMTALARMLANGKGNFVFNEFRNNLKADAEIDRL
jgi:peptidyl-prolyl cis-trans isomerase D